MKKTYKILIWKLIAQKTPESKELAERCRLDHVDTNSEIICTLPNKIRTPECEKEIDSQCIGCHWTTVNHIHVVPQSAQPIIIEKSNDDYEFSLFSHWRTDDDDRTAFDSKPIGGFSEY